MRFNAGAIAILAAIAAAVLGLLYFDSRATPVDAAVAGLPASAS